MDNESGVLAAFAENMKLLAKVRGRDFSHYPTGGQDRKLMGDTVFTNSTMYSLIEFKDSTPKFKSEKLKKSRVLALCKAVFNDRTMRDYHDSCHFIAGDDPRTAEQVMYIYRHAVCNREIFNKDPEKKLSFLSEKANLEQKLYLDDYAEDLFSSTPKFALSVVEFSTYLENLVNSTTSGRKNIEICLIASSFNEHNRAISVRFDDINALHEWAIDNIYKSLPHGALTSIRRGLDGTDGPNR